MPGSRKPINARLILSPSVSTGKVTILAACVSVPAWVRRQRQVRGFGTWVCWWWDWRRAGLGEAASALQGREEKAFRCLVGELLRAPLPWSKSPKPLLWELQRVREASSWW